MVLSVCGVGVSSGCCLYVVGWVRSVCGVGLSSGAVSVWGRFE